MPPLDIDTALDWRGRTVVDRDGDKIGKFEELYLDESDRPAWAAVTTGLFGMRQTFVPLSDAQAEGDVLRVPYGKEMVKDAPRIDPDSQLDPEEEAVLYRHYGVRGERDEVDEADPPRAEAPEDRERPRADIVEDAPPARAVDDTDDDTEPPRERAAATTGDGDDDGAEMIRSEEEVEVGKRRRVAGKARLKKYVVTEHVQKVVPVQREEVRVEFEPAEGEDERDAEAERAPEPDR
jgi:stress response protein YsnF